MIRVTVWNEYCHEQEEERIRKVYPNGIHNAIKDFLGANEDIEVTTVTLYDENMELRENAGITDELLANTDVMFWWGHVRHRMVDDEIVERVYQQVIAGMGLVVLFRTNRKHVKESIFILIGLILIGILSGTLIDLIGIGV